MRALVKSTESEQLTQAEANWLEAHAAYEKADFQPAAEAYQRACRLYDGLDDESYIDSMLGLGLCLDHLGRSEESEGLNVEVINSPVANVTQKAIARRNVVYAEGVRNFTNADFAAAHASFAKALTLYPDDDDFKSDILMWLGACHTQLGQFAAAGETYSDLLSSHAAHESVKTQASQHSAFAEGQVLFAARRYRDARNKFEELLKNRSDANEFRNDVVLMLAHCSFHLADFGQARCRYRQILKTRDASPEQKLEAREWRNALPGFFERLLRIFVRAAAPTRP